MLTLDLKPSHKAIRNYYEEIAKANTREKKQEGEVARHFADLLRHCAKQMQLYFVEQEPLPRANRRPMRLDGIIYNDLNLRQGIWEGKKGAVSLEKEIQLKWQDDYPNDNILFQSPERIILYQGRDTPVYDAPIAESPENLIAGLKLFFEYQKPEVANWLKVTEEFKGKIGDLGKQLVSVLERAHKTNKAFKEAFDRFAQLCKTAINPNLKNAAIEEMLIQHLLTERVFSTVFDDSEFVNKNVIAKEIEIVINALTSQSFNKSEFIKENQLERFYEALKRAANTIDDYSEKQPFLNAVYERFFQGFAVKVADTHGIVYTPQPIVDFMVNSVQEILQREFNRSLADSGVHIIDPFVGTGNFIIRILKEIHALNPFQLEHKYSQELHCNEVMLLPYYIASMNIEHTFYELTKKYKPFEGICLVDTFELIEDKQRELFVPENTQRVLKQKNSPIFVIIGNPPYNAWQQSENDNNKNRKYEKLDKMIAASYAKDSKATLKNALSDAYVKAFQWATWRLKDREEGIIAFVSNNSFLDGIAFDGMRQHLSQDFNRIYCLDLGGNSRKSLRVANVFDIRVGVSINLLVKNPKDDKGIFYAHIGDSLDKKGKLDYLSKNAFAKVNWQKIEPNEKHTWLTEGLHSEFDTFISLGTKEGKATKGESEGVIFKVYSGGIKTNRDAWAYNFNQLALTANMQKTIEIYNEQVFKWSRNPDKQANVDDFVLYDDTKLSWSSTLKHHLESKKFAEFTALNIRTTLYRPFSKRFLYFDNIFNDRPGLFPKIFPTPATENENQVIWVKVGSDWQMFALMVNVIPDLLPQGGSQCFPFYTYAEDGSNRQENITDWTLKHFQENYELGMMNEEKDTSIHNSSFIITKWDIFYYVYGLLHHPHYRTKYAANLKRELPRIPLIENFWAFSQAGKQLAELHLQYEQQAEYPLQPVYAPNKPLSYRVGKMRLTKEKDALIYNETLTLKGIPQETFKYRLGNRSALEWIVDQYQETIDGHSGSQDGLERISDYQFKTKKGSGILNDPNRLEDNQYILRLIRQVITVSLESVKIVESLPEFKLIG